MYVGSCLGLFLDFHERTRVELSDYFNLAKKALQLGWLKSTFLGGLIAECRHSIAATFAPRDLQF